MIKYFVNDEEVSKDKFDQLLETAIDDYNDEDRFDNYLDEVYPEPVEILNMHYNVSRVLHDVDPIAYRCEHANFRSDQLEEAQAELENSGYIMVDEDTFSIRDVEDEEDK